ncbi:sugar ABC transporter ATP-binding protein [bacterium]|nr:sugar ABC transporter ATP-binding protein [bacterium]
MKRITKQFPGVLALDGVDFSIDAGEVVALVGENGAGKSTLMNILAGVFPATAGEIIWDGRPVRIDSPLSARRLGIAIIHQELQLCENLDVAANLFLGREPRLGGPLGVLRRGRQYADARQWLDRVGLPLPADTPLSRLTVAQKQLVEIARALSVSARLVVMDEPTSALTETEARRLFELIAQLRAHGIAVIYISHRLEEVLTHTDRVVCLRDGRRVGAGRTADLSRDDIIKMMVGREVGQLFPKRPVPVREVVLDVRHLFAPGVSDVSFVLRRGEIVGFAGLVGAGRSEVVNALFGAVPKTAGEVYVRGRLADIRHPGDAVRTGLAYVTEDRKLLGLVLTQSVRDNTTLAFLRDICGGILLARGRETRVTKQAIERLRIKVADMHTPALHLSGGNQQKVVLAKWLAGTPTVVILDEPTRGIDVASKAEIHSLICDLAEEGAGVILISSEMEEVLAMSDRILVMAEGRITGELLRREATQERVMELASPRTARN